MPSAPASPSRTVCLGLKFEGMTTAPNCLTRTKLQGGRFGGMTAVPHCPSRIIFQGGRSTNGQASIAMTIHVPLSRMHSCHTKPRRFPAVPAGAAGRPTSWLLETSTQGTISTCCKNFRWEGSAEGPRRACLPPPLLVRPQITELVAEQYLFKNPTVLLSLGMHICGFTGVALLSLVSLVSH